MGGYAWLSHVGKEELLTLDLSTHHGHTLRARGQDFQQDYVSWGKIWILSQWLRKCFLEADKQQGRNMARVIGYMRNYLEEETSGTQNPWPLGPRKIFISLQL